MRHRAWSLAAVVGLCLVARVDGGRADDSAPPLLLAVPSGLSPILLVPWDNPLTADRVSLGRRLFFDKRLSRDGRVACASCHQPRHAFADRRPIAIGIGGRTGRRNVPSIVNRAYARVLFWDGRMAALEEQALAPLTSPAELGSTIEEIVDRLAADAGYVASFQRAFGDASITGARMAQALASFERTLLSGDSAVDRYETGGRKDALSPAAARGLGLFRGKARCHICHDGALFSDGRFHNTGVSWARLPIDLGRFEVTGAEADRGAFRTPSLRDVSRTAPYMHDGSFRTLPDVVAFYDRGGNRNPNLDGVIQPLRLTGGERRDLVAFLEALTGR
jgi:cytochrome c peroxidase